MSKQDQIGFFKKQVLVQESTNQTIDNHQESGSGDPVWVNSFSQEHYIMVRARILCSRKYPTLLTQFSLIFNRLWEYYNSPALPQNLNLVEKLNAIDKTHTLKNDTFFGIMEKISPLLFSVFYGNPNLSVNLMTKMQESIFYVPTQREIPRETMIEDSSVKCHAFNMIHFYLLIDIRLAGLFAFHLLGRTYFNFHIFSEIIENLFQQNHIPAIIFLQFCILYVNFTLENV